VAADFLDGPNPELARISARGERLCRWALMALPLAWAAFWLALPVLPREALPAPLDRAVDPTQLPATAIVAGFVISLGPLAATLIAIDALARLCASLRAGAVFTAGTVLLFRRIATALLVLPVVSMLARTLSVAVFHLPQHQLTLGLGISTAEGLLFLLGLLFRLMTHVMAEAAALAREHAEFV
jgi:hypothetical protein